MASAGGRRVPNCSRVLRMPSNTHSWNISPKEAIEVQRALRGQVRREPLGMHIRTIAGADISLNLYSRTVYAGVLVLSYPDLVPVEYSVVQTETEFPYIPGLLSFREIPALLECFKRLTHMPDVTMVDGQGITHPRHLGIAAHLGVTLDIPTIGVAKSRLYGAYDEPKDVGEATPVSDPKTHELLGYALKSKVRSNPLIISPGHRVSPGEALSITKSCLRGYRIPEPTRLTHYLVNTFRRGESLQEYGKGSVYNSIRS